MRIKSALIGSLIAISTAVSASAGTLEDTLKQLAMNELSGWLSDSSLVEAINSQNQEHAGLSQNDIDELDQNWRSQVGTENAELVSSLLERPVSEYLREQKNDANGLVTEVFLMDNRGLNVGQSDITSDYWQGDEAKFTETYGNGVGSIHVSEIELDESSGYYQSQVSMVVTDPANGTAIGAITFGINVDMLQ